jgi:hypothetical protein
MELKVLHHINEARQQKQYDKEICEEMLLITRDNL